MRASPVSVAGPTAGGFRLLFPKRPPSTLYPNYSDIGVHRSTPPTPSKCPKKSPSDPTLLYLNHAVRLFFASRGHACCARPLRPASPRSFSLDRLPLSCRPERGHMGKSHPHRRKLDLHSRDRRGVRRGSGGHHHALQSPVATRRGHLHRMEPLPHQPQLCASAEGS